jgi:gag-polyprotein putative aspartyl protease/MORN repeat
MFKHFPTLFAAAWLLAPLPAQAAPSFDCATVANPLATLICNSPHLPEIDVNYAKAYHALRLSLSPEGRVRLRAEEREFLKATISSCGVGINDDDAVSVEACVAAKYLGKTKEWTLREQSAMELLRVQQQPLERREDTKLAVPPAPPPGAVPWSAGKPAATPQFDVLPDDWVVPAQPATNPTGPQPDYFANIPAQPPPFYPTKPFVAVPAAPQPAANPFDQFDPPAAKPTLTPVPYDPWQAVNQEPLPPGLTLTPSGQTAPAAPGSSREVIPLDPQHGVFMLPVRINDAITIPFILDSGASVVVITADILSVLRRTGTISASDFIGTGSYTLADGSTISSDRYVLRKMAVGTHIITDVVASVAPAKGDPLLGQSFLSKLPAWTLDNARHALVLNDGAGPPGGLPPPDAGVWQPRLAAGGGLWGWWPWPYTGVFTWPDGDRYEGEIHDGKANGLGVQTWGKGNRYDGEFRDGMPNGLGVFTWPNRSRYRGEFRDGTPNATGSDARPSCRGRCTSGCSTG